MQISEIIQRLQAARAAHKAWVARAEALVSGLPLDKDQVPVLPTDCAFGQWYYGPGQMLRRLPAYQALEKPHDHLHRIYMEIFKMLYSEPEVSMFGRLLGKRARLMKQQQARAETLLVELRGTSRDLCDILERLEDQVRKVARARNKDTIDDTVDA